MPGPTHVPEGLAVIQVVECCGNHQLAATRRHGELASGWVTGEAPA